MPEICKCEDRPSLLGFSLDGQNVEAPVMMHEELCQASLLAFSVKFSFA